MCFYSHAEESRGGSPVNNLVVLCLVAMILSPVAPPTVLADCSPVGTWEGTEYSPATGMEATVEIVISSDGHVTGTSYLDLRPHYEHTITTYTDEYLDLWAGDCSITSNDQGNVTIEVLPGRWFNVTYDSVTEGTFAECDAATGTTSGTSYSPETGYLDEFSTWEIHRTSVPNKVANTYPSDATDSVSVWPVLDWSWPPATYGYGACSYDVYLGTELKAVNNAADPDVYPGRGNHSGTTYTPDELHPGTTYYWRIDARNTNGVTKGDVWSFTTCGHGLAFAGKINARSLEIFARNWLSPDCAEPDWCEGMDINCDGAMELSDFAVLGRYWFEDMTLIGHWRMDDNAPDKTVLDGSMRGNHGIAQRNTDELTAAGMVKEALAFDGSSDYIHLGDSAFLPSGNDARTVSAWVKTDRSNGDNFIFTYGNLSRGNMFAFTTGSTYVAPGNTVCVLCWGGVRWETGCPMPVDRWTHLAITHDQGDTRLYMDGMLEASTDTLEIDTRLDGDAFIGKLANGDGPFKGRLDDVRLYQRALRPDEIALLHDPGRPRADAGPDQTVNDADEDGTVEVVLDGSGSTDPDGTIVSWTWWDDHGDIISDGENPTAALSIGMHIITLTVTDNDGNTDSDIVGIQVLAGTTGLPTCTLIGHWAMNDNAGNKIVTDSSEQANHGTAQKNTSSLQTPGIIDGALSFNGISDFISVPVGPDWQLPENFIIEVCARFDSFNPKWWEAAFVGRDEGGGNRNKWIFTYDSDAGTTLFHTHRKDAPAVQIRGNSWTAQTGEWYFLAVSYLDGVFTLYRDGQPDGSVVSSPLFPDVDTPLTIGWAEEAGKFHGLIDDVRMYELTIPAGDALVQREEHLTDYLFEYILELLRSRQ